MDFFNSAVDVLQTLVIALGAGLGIWGGINLMEGYGNDNPGAKIQGKDGYNYYTERRTPIPFCRNPSGGFLRRITRKPPYRRWGLLGEKLMKDKNQNQRKSIERTIKIIKDGKEYKFYSDTAGADIFLDIYKKARKVENIQIQSKERKQQALYNIQFVGERINKFFQCGCNNCVGKHCSDCALTEALQICDKFVKILENDK